MWQDASRHEPCRHSFHKMVFDCTAWLFTGITAASAVDQSWVTRLFVPSALTVLHCEPHAKGVADCKTAGSLLL